MVHSYREILVRQFEMRRARNRGYSLRAFARDIGLRPSHLSDVLAGHKGLSLGTAHKIALHLKMDLETKSFFSDLVESEHARSSNERLLARNRLQQRQPSLNWEMLDDVNMNIAARWYYPAIMELVSIHRGQIDAELCAKALSIDLELAEAGIKFLEDQKLILKIETSYVRLKEYVQFLSDVPNSLYRDFHKQLSELTVDRLVSTHPQTRYTNSTIMSFDSSRINEAKEFLDAVFEEFMKKFRSSNKDDSVYALTLNLFRSDRNLS